ncbi:MAG: SDR family oxidoreductase [Candidatus Abyssobacteria bacterium SURF_5]|uniref:SDR family oxidoreductase n=1 Tax=Abyssobacteria bacterium (strain SURF_5) TaxID=2093360 RepID=A0A3A4NFW8_ABYX5|nr:MAG: SDR family oxidoreductase [Candidatus Abyssubacteria bacterium SURF_5]
MAEKGKKQFPRQRQKQPGIRSKMRPKPLTESAHYKPSEKLLDKATLITGGDSGIGRAVAILFAKEGADVAIVYLSEHEDAADTKRLVEAEGRRCILISGDVGRESFCFRAVEKTIKAFGRLNILINNAGEQHVVEDFAALSGEQIEKTFKTNIFSMFYMIKAALPHLAQGSVIINSASITAYLGHPKLVDYASTKGAIVALTRSLALKFVDRGIRVNGVAPGPIWTPLIPASYDEDHVAEFGGNTPMGRAGQPEEVAPCYVFLASNDSSYMTGQILHPNGGRIVNG